MGLPQRCAYFGYCARNCVTAAFGFAANLSFAHEDSKAALNDVARWRPAGSIEGGGTRAFVKNAQAAMYKPAG